ncbi:unnamed protein product, partial [Mesorhabditis spiculigera]
MLLFIYSIVVIGTTFACDCNEAVERLSAAEKLCNLPYVVHLKIDKATKSTTGHKLDRHVDYDISLLSTIRDTKFNSTGEAAPTKMKSFVLSALCGVVLRQGEYILSGLLDKEGVISVNHCEMIERFDAKDKEKKDKLLKTDCSKIPDLTDEISGKNKGPKH